MIGSMSEPPQTTPSKRTTTLFGIAAFKLGKGLFFFLVAFSIYCLSDDNLPDAFRSLLTTLRVDPGHKIFDRAFRWLGSITESNMLWVAGGTTAYAILALVEGIGLFMRYYWAAYLAIAESAVFIPLEVAELVHRFTWSMVCLLVLNIFILVYLWRNRHRLFRHIHEHGSPPGQP